MRISGTFVVQLKPLESHAKAEDGNQLAHMSIDKTFQGDLNAKSQGQMLSAITATEGSAGYVAMELVTGELNGKKGSFVLQHYGTMNKGKDHLILEVLPDSGTDELQGLSGKMNIRVDQGVHHYKFDYIL